MSLGKILPVKRIHLEQKNCEKNIMPVEENLHCRRKKVPVHSHDIPCHLKFKYKLVDETARMGQ